MNNGTAGGGDQGTAGDDQVFGESFGMAVEEIKKEEVILSEEKAGEAPPVVASAPTDAGTSGDSPPPAGQPAAKEDYEQKWKTLQGILKHEKETWEGEKTKLIADLEEAKKATPPAAGTAGTAGDDSLQAFMDSLTDEQKAALAEYDEEFDVVSKMEGLKREKALAALRKEFVKWKDELLAQVAPASEFISKAKERGEIDAREAHFQMIREAHSDFETHRDSGEILKWIETKPGYMKKAMLETYSKGKAEDIVELLNDFKDENNIPLQTNVVNLDQKKEERRKALIQPNTKKSAVNSGMKVANDFEGAFHEAVKKG